MALAIAKVVFAIDKKTQNIQSPLKLMDLREVASMPIKTNIIKSWVLDNEAFRKWLSENSSISEDIEEMDLFILFYNENWLDEIYFQNDEALEVPIMEYILNLTKQKNMTYA
ncbi:MAG: hypothetical protein L6U99_02965 [Clostridium sp.]|nr:MAG: hypothetical protein L6U99_02965 [Clostridium sp.]